MALRARKCCRWRHARMFRSSWRAAAMATSSTCPCSAICVRDGILAVTEVCRRATCPQHSRASGSRCEIRSYRPRLRGRALRGILCAGQRPAVVNGSPLASAITAAITARTRWMCRSSGCRVLHDQSALVQLRCGSATVMLNLLGDLWFQDGETARAPAWDPDPGPARSPTCICAAMVRCQASPADGPPEHHRGQSLKSA